MKRSGPTGVKIELKQAANEKLKLVSGEPGERRRRAHITLNDVQRVTDSTGKVIYESKPAEAAKTAAAPVAPKPAEAAKPTAPAAPVEAAVIQQETPTREALNLTGREMRVSDFLSKDQKTELESERTLWQDSQDKISALESKRTTQTPYEKIGTDRQLRRLRTAQRKSAERIDSIGNAAKRSYEDYISQHVGREYDKTRTEGISAKMEGEVSAPTSASEQSRTTATTVREGGAEIVGPGMEAAFGAAAPREFEASPAANAMRQLQGWARNAKQALANIGQYFKPPRAGDLPEVDIQTGAVLPRLPNYEVEKQIASSPHGMARVPGLGAAVDPRAMAHTPADAAFLARANSVSKGKTFAALWAQTQWRNKDLFPVDKETGTFQLANGERGYLSDVIEAELADPGSQPITHAQWQWIHNEWKPVLDEINRMMHNEGIRQVVTEDMDVDLTSNYFPRPAIGKRTRDVTGAGGRPAGKPGAKQFFQRSRKFESEAEGARPGTAGTTEGSHHLRS